jgi:adenylate cyclase
LVPEGSAGDELRPVTVLFADIVGSTALGERLAPDEVKTLVGECVTMMSMAVEEYGGTVQAYQPTKEENSEMEDA